MKTAFLALLVIAICCSSAIAQYCTTYAVYPSSASYTTRNSDGSTTTSTTMSYWMNYQTYCNTLCISATTSGSGCTSVSGSNPTYYGAGAYGGSISTVCATTSTCPSTATISSCTYTYNCSSPSCFSGDAKVETRDRGVISITDVKEGDFLKAYNVEEKKEIFSRFTQYSHADAQTYAKFIELTTASNKKLKLSELHLIMKQSGEFVFATELKLNDVVITSGGNQESITGLDETIERGVYAPLTEQGTVIVNNIVASCYANYKSHAVAHLVHPIVVSFANFINGFLGYKDATEMVAELNLYSFISKMPMLSSSLAF